MDDTISRQAAIELVKDVCDAIMSGCKRHYDSEVGDEVYDDTLEVDAILKCNKGIRNALRDMPPVQPELRWIPVKTRPMTEEERWYWEEHYGVEFEAEDAVSFDCQMPDDGQEIWVCSKCGNVWQDTCEVDEGIGLEGNGDWNDIVAWMPYERPSPWKGEAE